MSLSILSSFRVPCISRTARGGWGGRWLTLNSSVDRYKLAEKVSDRLEEMGKDLTGIIEAINGASANLNQTNKEDDPVRSDYWFISFVVDPLLTLALAIVLLYVVLSACSLSSSPLVHHAGFSLPSADATITSSPLSPAHALPSLPPLPSSLPASLPSLSPMLTSHDQLSQIVRVLNSHLASLQWIDQNASALEAKVAAAVKTSQALRTNGADEANRGAVEDFHRSYLGRR